MPCHRRGRASLSAAAGNPELRTRALRFQYGRGGVAADQGHHRRTPPDAAGKPGRPLQELLRRHFEPETHTSVARQGFRTELRRPVCAATRAWSRLIGRRECPSRAHHGSRVRLRAHAERQMRMLPLVRPACRRAKRDRRPVAGRRAGVLATASARHSVHGRRGRRRDPRRGFGLRRRRRRCGPGARRGLR